VGIDFIAHALPAREAVWWGCLCLQHACGSNLSPADKAPAKPLCNGSWSQPKRIGLRHTRPPKQPDLLPRRAC
jgi:hypothetical protein